MTVLFDVRERYAALLDCEVDAELFVRQSLSFLEADFRKLALLALADWERLGITAPELFQAVASLQRPSWGMWNGLLTALRKARNSLLRKGNEEIRQHIESARLLSGILRQFEIRLDRDIAASLTLLGEVTRTEIPKKLRASTLLTIPINLRNRVAHDAPTQDEWWAEAAKALRPLIDFHSHMSPLYLVLDDDLDSQKKYPAPWFKSDGHQVLSFNGLANDMSVIYVSDEGSVNYSSEATHPTLLAFQRLLGRAESRDADFRVLLSKLAPEEIKGVIMGDYLVGRPVGSGGFATVHLGRQLSTGRKMAIKILHDGQSDRVQERFHQEARFLSQLDHANIVKVYGYGEEAWSAPRSFSLSGEGWFEQFSKGSAVKSYIAMEWVDGGTVEEATRDSQSSGQANSSGSNHDHRQLAEWFSQAAGALSAVHNSGLVHRDIKPSNLMVDADGNIKLMDFGIARRQDTNRTLQTTTGNAFGTPAYMSPEQIRCADRDDEVGPPTDVYSLCATFYELFASRRIFNHDTVGFELVTTKKLSGELPERPSISQKTIPWELETIVMGGLEPDVHDRFHTMDELKRDIDHFLADEPIQYKRPDIWRRGRLAYRRNKTLFHVVVCFTLAAVAGTCFYLTSLNAKNDQLAGKNKELENKNRQVSLEKAEAIKQKKIAIAEETKTKKQKLRAEHHLSLAQNAVGDFLYTVAASDDFRAKGLEGLQENLLTDGANRLEQLLELESENPEVIESQQNQKFMLAVVMARLGKRHQSGETAREVMQAYATNWPKRSNSQLILFAQCAELSGKRHASLGQIARADVEFSKGDRAIQVVLSRVVTLPKALGVASQIQLNRAIMYSKNARQKETEAARQKGLAYLQRFLDVLPNDPAGLALQQKLSAVGFNQGNAEDHLKTQRTAVANLKESYKQNPDDFDLLTDLANSLQNLGSELLQRGKSDEALKVFKEGISLVKAYSERNPASDYPANYVRNMNTFIAILTPSGNPANRQEVIEAAINSYEKRIEFDREQWRLYSQAIMSLAQLHRDQGRQDQALDLYNRMYAESTELLKQIPDDNTALFQAANSLSELAQLSAAAGQTADARSKIKAAIQYATELRTRAPLAHHDILMATLHQVHYQIIVRDRRFMPAQKEINKAIELLEGLLKQNLLNESEESRLASMYSLRAELERHMRQFDAAHESCEKALLVLDRLKSRIENGAERLKGKYASVYFQRFFTFQMESDHQSQLDMLPLIRAFPVEKKDQILDLEPHLLISLKRHSDAMNAAKAMVIAEKTLQSKVNHALRAVWVASDAIKVVLEDKSLTEKEREDVATQYAKEATNQLVFMGKLGLWKKPGALNAFNDKKFEALRQRPTFQKWLRRASSD